MMEKGARIEAVRSFFDGGVNAMFRSEAKWDQHLFFKLQKELRKTHTR